MKMIYDIYGMVIKFTVVDKHKEMALTDPSARAIMIMTILHNT